jgi:hypothetical protein
MSVNELLAQHQSAMEAYDEYTIQMEREQARIDQMSAEEYRAYAQAQQEAAQAAARPQIQVNLNAATKPGGAIPIPVPPFAQPIFLTLFGLRTRIRPLHIPIRSRMRDDSVSVSEEDTSDTDTVE